MKKEDIDFLRELQHELNTQDHDSQAAPRYWGVAENKVVAIPDGCGDAFIYIGDGGVLTCEEFVDFVESGEYNSGYEDDWQNVDKNDIDELVEFAQDTLEWNDVRVVYQELQRDIITHDSNVFLTKRACQAHIECNRYHYSQPHTYAMTAWRNPEFEHLMTILQTMNIDDIKITEE